MNDLTVKLEVFEGPLDLLLHLIKTLEIDIYDIPISEITEQYMSYISSMKTLDLEVAGEYIVMAATLMSIKSKMLLPKVEVTIAEDEYEGEDPRDLLVQQLLEYRKFKYAAGVLKEKETNRGQYYTKEATNLSEYSNEPVELEPNEITTIDLFLAIHDIINRQKDLVPMETSILMEEFSINDRVDFIKEQLDDESFDTGVTFSSLFYYYTRNEIVTTFMALLELMKSGYVSAIQQNKEATIMIYRNKGNEESE